ncbi:MAG: hypothetical protein H7Y11_10760, partial [Armatimonadetes bacterium]|nr:hypothetical protein [Anaerolineae bacterium]
AEQPPDLIILDDVLPGMWGDEVRQHLQANEATRALKIIIYTGRVDKIAAYQQQPGVYAVLPKPSLPVTVLNTIKASLL